MMLCILLLFVVDSSCLDQYYSIAHYEEDIPLQEFGCVYKDSRHYSLDTKWTSHWPNDPIYSAPREEVLIFSSDDEFKEFYNKVDAIVKNELQSNTFDNIKPFISMIRRFHNYEIIRKNHSFSKFFKVFLPTYPLKPGNDDIAALLRVYHEVLTEDSRVENAFVMATKNTDVPQRQVDVYFNSSKKGSRQKEPMNDFQHNGVVGIINFAIEDINEKRLGSIVIDMLDPKYPTPKVMAKKSDILNTEVTTQYNALNEKNKATSKFDSNLDYISINYFKAPNSTNGKVQNEVVRRDIIYKYKSLCSFIQTTEKGQFLQPERSIYKLNEDGKYLAYVVVDVLTNRVAMACPTMESHDLTLPVIYNGAATTSERQVFTCVEEHLDMQAGALKTTLDRLYEAMRAEKLKKSFSNLSKQVLTPVYKKNKIKVMWELFEINFLL